MIPYGRHHVTQSDIDAVVEVLRSKYLTQGPTVPLFEERVANVVGAKFAVALNSATSALHTSCLALRLGNGDRLWTVPNSFVASANCALYCGADVDFVDIDPTTWNLSVPRLREKLQEAEATGALPKVIVPVHFGGQPTDQEAIWELAKQYGFKVLEDASHSIGASRNGVPVGSCRWSDITVFSFHPVKIITSGEGGMALTNEIELAESMRMLRSHGITREPSKFIGGDQSMRRGIEKVRGPGEWYYEQQILGFNYRMTDVQAALGLSQLARMAEYVERRNELACRYDAALRELPLILPEISEGNRSAFHLYVVRLPKSYNKKSHREVFDNLRRSDIGVNLHYMPIHLQPFYRERGFYPQQFPEAEAHGISAITLPLFPTMSNAEQYTVISAVRSLF